MLDRAFNLLATLSLPSLPSLAANLCWPPNQLKCLEQPLYLTHKHWFNTAVLALYQEFVKARESVELRLWSRGGKECFFFSQTLDTLPHSLSRCWTGEEKRGKEWERAETSFKKWKRPYFQGAPRVR